MTVKAWEALTPKQRWDVIVAMRGPDCRNSEPIKWVSTAIIRHAMRDVIRVGGLINPYLKAVFYCPNLPKGVKGEATFDPHHFSTHVEEASEILGIPYLMIPADIWWPAMNASHFVQGAVNLHEALSKLSPPASAEGKVALNELGAYVKKLGSYYQ